MRKIFNSQFSIVNSKAGFTLVELLLVMGLIALLATVVFAVFDPLTQLQRGRDARRKADLDQIKKALEDYYNDAGRYPLSSGDYEILDIPFGSGWSPYMNIIPKDPSGRLYRYFVDASGQQYWLYASLERGGKDPQACKYNEGPCQGDPFGSACQCTNVNPATVKCGGGTDYCTYGVTSSNTSP